MANRGGSGAMFNTIARPMGSRGGSGAMFDTIAKHYDRLNRLISLGFDRRWRKAAVNALTLPPEARLLDIATGTASFALEIARRHPHCHITGIDPSDGMLRIAQNKVRAAKHPAPRIELLRGTAEALPVATQTLDAVTVSFGVRNFPNRARGLSEIHRTLKDGGQLVILELCMPHGHFLSSFACRYVRRIIPLVGRLWARRGPYQYLTQSMNAFPPETDFSQELHQAGFRVHAQRAFMWGTCHLFVAEAIHAAK